MIRVLVVDDHPALRTGLLSVLRSEPGLVSVGTATRPAEALTKARHFEPDVVVVDYQLPEEDGLVLCNRLKGLSNPPRVLMYSAYADFNLTVPAMVAGADGMVNKAAHPDELLDAIRKVARGQTVLPPIWPELLDASAAKLVPEDLPVLGMIVEGTPISDIAEVLRIEKTDLDCRIRVILGRLRPEVARVQGDFDRPQLDRRY
jgi:DNA-binding NarL/FixJ family response regulator